MDWVQTSCGNGAACVQVARCDTSACVEVESGEHGVYIRSTLAPDLHTRVSHDEWRAFLAGAKAGDFDHI